MWVPLLVWFPDCVIFFVQCNSWLHNGLTNSKFHCFFCSSLCLQNSHWMNGCGFWNDCSKMQATDVFSFIVKLELFLYNKSIPITLVFWFVTCGAARSVVYIELLHLRLGLPLESSCVQQTRRPKQHTRLSDSINFPSSWTSCEDSILPKMVRMRFDYRNVLLLKQVHFVVLLLVVTVFCTGWVFAVIKTDNPFQTRQCTLLKEVPFWI